MRISDWSSDVCSSDLQLSAATHCLSENPIRARCSPRLRRRKGPRPFMLEIRRSTSRQRERLRCRRLRRSEEHTSELQSLMRISYAVFCLKKKKTQANTNTYQQKHIQKTDRPDAEKSSC